MPERGDGMDTRELVLEQYKSLVGDVGNIGVRYATANGFYLSVLTALLGVIAYVGAGKPIGDMSYLVMFLVAAFGTVICWIWRETVSFFARLFYAKFELLKKLETELGVAVKVYTEEDELVYWEVKTDSIDKKIKLRRPGLIAREKMVPVCLGVLFLFIGAVALLLLVVRTIVTGFAV
jgi:hypothetical protein